MLTIESNNKKYKIKKVTGEMLTCILESLDNNNTSLVDSFNTDINIIETFLDDKELNIELLIEDNKISYKEITNIANYIKTNTLELLGCRLEKLSYLLNPKGTNNKKAEKIKKSRFDEYDLKENFTTKRQLALEEEINKITKLDTLYSIYRIGIDRDNMSYEDMESCDILKYIDYIIFTLKTKDDSNDEN